MSTYQLYEFQAIDRPLSDEEQRAVSSLSSRVKPHPRRATFLYNFGDFSADPQEFLARYFDAMFYIANWGTSRLMFRFPRHLVDGRRFEPFYVEDHITWEWSGDHLILDIHLWDEDLSYGWIDGEGTLDGLIDLRDNILRKDLRVLYLAWLAMTVTWEIEDDKVEPPVPPGLKNLSPALHNFIEAFRIDEYLVRAAARRSTRMSGVQPDAFRGKIAQLSRAECDEWLERLAQEEDPHLSLTFRGHLLAGQGEVSLTAGERTVSELRGLAKREEERARKKEAEEEKARRMREAKALASKEAETWRHVETLIEQGRARPYDDALELLLKLRDLANYQGSEARFAQRIAEIRDTYARRKALLRRLDRAGLP